MVSVLKQQVYQNPDDAVYDLDPAPGSVSHNTSYHIISRSPETGWCNDASFWLLSGIGSVAVETSVEYDIDWTNLN